MIVGAGRGGSGRLAVAFGLLLVAVGCSPRPFVVDSPVVEIPESELVEVELGAHDYDPRPRPLSFCYSSQFNNPEDVIERARELCPNNGTLRYYSQDAVFNECALFQPFRVTYICTPGPQPPSAYE